YHRQHGTEHVETATELKLAKEIARAALLLQAENGGIRVAPIGARLPIGDPNGDTLYNTIYAVDNIIWFAALDMLHKITKDPLYGQALDALKAYLISTYDSTNHMFVRGSRDEAGTGNWQPLTDLFQTEAQVMAMLALTPGRIDRWFNNSGEAYLMWQRVRAEAEIVELDELVGIDFTNFEAYERFPLVNGLLSFSGIAALQYAADFYQDSHPTYRQAMLQDATELLAGTAHFRDQSATWIAYAYTWLDGNFETGFDNWIAPPNPTMSLASTGWAILQELNYNPFFFEGVVVGNEDVDAPTVPITTPADGATGVAVDAPIIAHVRDTGVGVDRASVMMTVRTIDNRNVPGELGITGPEQECILTYTHKPFGYGETIIVTIDARDLEGRQMETHEYSFRTSFFEGENLEYDVSNYPNPFISRTTVRYTLPEASQVNAKIYDMRGRFIRDLGVNYGYKGANEIIWDALDNSGRPVARGTYIVRLIIGDNRVITHKMMHLGGTSAKALFGSGLLLTDLPVDVANTAGTDYVNLGLFLLAIVALLVFKKFLAGLEHSPGLRSYVRSRRFLTHVVSAISALIAIPIFAGNEKLTGVTTVTTEPASLIQAALTPVNEAVQHPLNSTYMGAAQQTDPLNIWIPIAIAVGMIITLAIIAYRESGKAIHFRARNRAALIAVLALATLTGCCDDPVKPPPVDTTAPEYLELFPPNREENALINTNISAVIYDLESIVDVETIEFLLGVGTTTTLPVDEDLLAITVEDQGHRVVVVYDPSTDFIYGIHVVVTVRAGNEAKPEPLSSEQTWAFNTTTNPYASYSNDRLISIVEDTQETLHSRRDAAEMLFRRAIDDPQTLQPYVQRVAENFTAPLLLQLTHSGSLETMPADQREAYDTLRALGKFPYEMFVVNVLRAYLHEIGGVNLYTRMWAVRLTVAIGMTNNITTPDIFPGLMNILVLVFENNYDQLIQNEAQDGITTLLVHHREGATYSLVYLSVEPAYERLRIAAIDALVELGDASDAVLDGLRRAVRIDNPLLPTVREDAAFAIGELGRFYSPAVHDLADAVDPDGAPDAVAAVRIESCNSLGDIVSMDDDTETVTRVIDVLTQTADRDSDQDARDAAAAALARIQATGDSDKTTQLNALAPLVLPLGIDVDPVVGIIIVLGLVVIAVSAYVGRGRNAKRIPTTVKRESPRSTVSDQRFSLSLDCSRGGSRDGEPVEPRHPSTSDERAISLLKPIAFASLFIAVAYALGVFDLGLDTGMSDMFIMGSIIPIIKPLTRHCLSEEVALLSQFLYRKQVNEYLVVDLLEVLAPLEDARQRAIIFHSLAASLSQRGIFIVNVWRILKAIAPLEEDIEQRAIILRELTDGLLKAGMGTSSIEAIFNAIAPLEDIEAIAERLRDAVDELVSLEAIFAPHHTIHTVLKAIAPLEDVRHRAIILHSLAEFLLEKGMHISSIEAISSTIAPLEDIEAIAERLRDAADELVSLEVILERSYAICNILAAIVPLEDVKAIAQRLRGVAEKIVSLEHTAREVMIDICNIRNILAAIVPLEDVRDKIGELERLVGALPEIEASRSVLEGEMRSLKEQGEFSRRIVSVNKNGSGFVVARVHGYYVLLTNTHVVKNIKAGGAVLLQTNTYPRQYIGTAHVAIRNLQAAPEVEDIAMLVIRENEVEAGDLIPIPIKFALKGNILATLVSGFNKTVSSGRYVSVGLKAILLKALDKGGDSGSPYVVKAKDDYYAVAINQRAGPVGIPITSVMLEELGKAVNQEKAHFEANIQDVEAKRAIEQLLAQWRNELGAEDKSGNEAGANTAMGVLPFLTTALPFGLGEIDPVVGVIIALGLITISLKLRRVIGNALHRVAELAQLSFSQWTRAPVVTIMLSAVLAALIASTFLGAETVLSIDTASLPSTTPLVAFGFLRHF
ncbi:T9SS type A sorting domain-containing protein, partial [Candidatus Omnitrophota bacterium]